MEAVKVEMYFVNFDGLSEQQIIEEVECAQFGNDCILPSIVTVEIQDVGVWTDDHPLNLGDRVRAEYERLFSAQKS